MSTEAVNRQKFTYSVTAESGCRVLVMRLLSMHERWSRRYTRLLILRRREGGAKRKPAVPRVPRNLKCVCLPLCSSPC